MIRTLHYYLSRDLAKVIVLALPAFTLVMTVFAIIEPLRKQGLSTEQVITLFGYTVPMMVSLTLPVAALFATTIVYGRFSQDNELLACRASGISTFALLKPALVLGALVTAVSLGLSNFVTPKLAAMCALAVKANVRNIAYYKLRTQNYLKYDRYVVHADDVEMDKDTIHDVVVIDTSDAEDLQMFSASIALSFFDTDELNETYATFGLYNTAQFGARSRGIVQQAFTSLESVPVPAMVREEPSWYEWNKLLDTMRQPIKNADVLRALAKIRRQYCRDTLVREVANAINRDNVYSKLHDEDRVYEIRAARAEPDPDGKKVRLFSSPRQKVEVEIKRKGREKGQRLGGEMAKITPMWTTRQFVGSGLEQTSVQRERWLVTVELFQVPEGPAREGQQGASPRREKLPVGNLEMPEDIVERTMNIPLERFYEHPGEFASNASVRSQLDYLMKNTLAKLRSGMVAELHVRIAYSLSCFLLVAMGAALGLIFRGGQIISAFAISVVPAFVIIIMVLMGKAMIRNIEVPMWLGLASIWGGIVVLLVANICVYFHLTRR